MLVALLVVAGSVYDFRTRLMHELGHEEGSEEAARIWVESLFFLALYASWHSQEAAEPFLRPSVWLPARLPLLLGAAFISALVLRRLRRP